MDIRIRKSTIDDLDAFMQLRYRACRVAYINTDIGITEELFSEDILLGDEDLDRYRGYLSGSNDGWSYVATMHNRVVGGISLQRPKKGFEVHGFYVDPEFQRRGIGRSLWETIEGVTKGNPLELEVYSHAITAVNMYFAQGFRIDEERPFVLGKENIGWKEWPDDYRAQLYRMIRD